MKPSIELVGQYVLARHKVLDDCQDYWSPYRFYEIINLGYTHEGRTGIGFPSSDSFSGIGWYVPYRSFGYDSIKHWRPFIESMKKS